MSTPPQSSSTSTSQAPTNPAASTMPKPHTLTLILAATPSLGIGRNGALPWPQLKKEMGYFARVTKRVSCPQPITGPGKVNAVLMGRKTWDSIPRKFRPLRDRLNVVVTRNAAQFTQSLDRSVEGKANGEQGIEGPLIASSLLDALHHLDQRDNIERVFVIGGASIYAAALELPQTRRVLLTSIEKEFECDTHFPMKLEEGRGWRRAGTREWGEWTGEEGDGGVEEGGVRFGFGMWVRE